MTRRKKRWLWLAMVPVLVAVVAFAAKGRGSSDKAEEKGPDIPTLAARMGNVQVVVREVGTVEPEVKVDVKSNLSGRVVDLKVRAGDRVRKGELLACYEGPGSRLGVTRIDSEQSERSVGKACVQPLQRRHLLDAGSAPGCPEGYQQSPPSQRLDVMTPPIEVHQSQRGGPIGG